MLPPSTLPFSSRSHSASIASIRRPKERLLKNFRSYNIPLFASTKDDDLCELASRCKVEEYEEDDYVFREDDPADRFFIVAHGAVRITSRAADMAARAAAAADGKFLATMNPLESSGGADGADSKDSAGDDGSGDGGGSGGGVERTSESLLISMASERRLKSHFSANAHSSPTGCGERNFNRDRGIVRCRRDKVRFTVYGIHSLRRLLARSFTSHHIEYLIFLSQLYHHHHHHHHHHH